MGAVEKRLFLVDAMPLFYRGYFIFMKNPRMTAGGQNTSALFGFVNSLMQVIEKGKPTHLAVVIDREGPTFRHQRFPAYKAQRESQPEAIAWAIPRALELAEALNIPMLSCEGYEADDIIGTLAGRAEAAGFETYMVTPDKDFSQLVTARTRLYRPGKAGEPPEILGVAEVLARWEISDVSQVVDIQGLAGDAVDNIPGVPGIGQKTAATLIQQFGSLEQVLAGTATLRGKQKEKLEAFADQARLSKELATICRDVPIPIDLDRLAVAAPDKARALELFERYEFRTLGSRLFGREQRAASVQGDLFGDAMGGGVGAPPVVAEVGEGAEERLKTLADVRHDYTCVTTGEARARLAGRLREAGSFCFDVETTGLDPRAAALVGIAFALAPHEAFYVPVLGDAAALEDFRAVLEDPMLEKTGHNLKFDISVLRAQGVGVRGPLFDTMLAHYVVEPEQRHGMDHLARQYLHYAPEPIEALIGPKGKGQRTMAEVDVARVAVYAAEDADITLQLRAVLEPLVSAQEAGRALDLCENPLIPVLVDMENAGVRIDSVALAQVSEMLGGRLVVLEQQIHAAAGTVFNIASPRQLGDILFDYMGIAEKPKRTRTGQYSTDEQVLAQLAPKHRIAALVLEYRNCQKLKGTYVDTLPAAVNPRTGRVHTTYTQAATATGRMASQNPNLQNIPIRSELGREIRKAFVPRGEGWVLLSADYSQIELRVMAELSGDAAMLRTFQAGADIHAATAARVRGVAEADVTPEMRRQAKMVNFGIIYGISAFGLAQRLGVSRREAQELIDAYFVLYPGVKTYMDETVAFARQHGYVRTLFGRRRPLPDIHSRNATIRQGAERNAINTPIQGTAADMIKVAMVRIHGDMGAAGLASRMLLQVHDELVFDCPVDEVDTMRVLVARGMQEAVPMRVPIEVDLSTGDNWLEAH